MNAAVLSPDATKLREIRAALAAIAPADWTRAHDDKGGLIEARGAYGELLVLARFEAASVEEQAFAADAPDMVAFLLRLLKEAFDTIRDLKGAPPHRNQAAGEPAASDVRNFAAECAMKCQEPAFMVFLEQRHGLERPLTPERVAQKGALDARRHLTKTTQRWRVGQRSVESAARELRRLEEGGTMNAVLNFDAYLSQPHFETEPLFPLIMDSFAGGGGASTGIEMALGRSPDIAINHNPAALALHEANHPETLHLSENVYKVDPLDHVAGKHVGLAWFSPDCKHFSKAKGGKPVERNIRDLAWIIPGWVERIQNSGGGIDVVILENVEEFQTWGPLLDTERGLMPDPEARGETFLKWCKALRRLGGKIEWRELRACDYGAPTIRKRLFVIVRFDGQKIVWPKPTHGKPDDPDVIAGRKLPWRTAAEIIDWSLPCPSIFDTGAEIMAKLGLRAVRPLADATMSRVARGVDRYVLKAKRPFLVSVAHGYSGGRREYPIDDPFGVVTAGGISHAVVSPSVIRFNTGATGHDAREPLATITANSFKKRPGGAAPLGVVAPVLSAYYGKGEGSDDRSASVEKPINTVVTENRHAVIAPVLTYGQQGGANRSVEDPAHTITASKKDQNAVVVPTLIGCGGRAGQSRARGGDEPMATQTAKADVCVAAAFLAQHNNDGRREGGVNPGRSAEEPVSTITANPQQAVIAAFVSRQFGTSVGHDIEEPTHTATAKVNKSMLVAPHLMTMRNSGKPFNGADEPTHTITAGGAGISVVAPFVQKYYGTGDGARLDDPCHSVTTKDRFGYVEGEIGWPPFTEEQAARARQVADFMRAHGFWDEREFVTVEIAGDLFTIVDIGMRMLTPRELFSAQGFPPDYIIDLEFNGKPLPKSDQIACCGNSVSPPMAAALVAANCGHLMRFQEAAE